MSSLVGTKWVLNSVVNEPDDANFDINFTSNNQTFTYILPYPTIEDWAFGYEDTLVYDSGTWTNEAYRTIEITGGTDADTTSTFYTWLTNNATQVSVVDLSGTTWTINSTTCSAGYGQFNIYYSINNIISSNVLGIGYSFGGMPPGITPTANSLFDLTNISDISINDVLSFGGGTDATNPDLIVWLTNNATYQEPPSGHTLTIDGTDYTIDDNTNLLVNSTGLYNSTTSTQVWAYAGDTKFLGFATSSGGAIVYDINDTITLTGDLTLYSVQQERMPLYIDGERTDKYHGKVVNKIGDYFVARYEYSITTSVTNGTYSGATSILVNGTATITITADSGYELPSSITVTGASYTYENGVISLSNPTGDVTISVVCESAGYSVTFTASGDWDSESYGSVQIYDGQDNTGTLLLNQTPANKSAFPMTFNISSGYCYIRLNGPVIMSPNISSNDYEDTTGYNVEESFLINKNGSIDIAVETFYD